MKAFKNKTASAGVNRTEALKCIPLKNREVEERRLDNGDLLLIYPVSVRPLFEKLLGRLGRVSPKGLSVKKLQLDMLGTAVWDQLDDRRTVKSIVQWFAGCYQMHPREAEIAVTQFLKDLGKRGLIGLK